MKVGDLVAASAYTLKRKSKGTMFWFNGDFGVVLAIRSRGQRPITVQWFAAASSTVKSTFKLDHSFRSLKQFRGHKK